MASFPNFVIASEAKQSMAANSVSRPWIAAAAAPPRNDDRMEAAP
jgi:hypothetical protein